MVVYVGNGLPTTLLQAGDFTQVVFHPGISAPIPSSFQLAVEELRQMQRDWEPLEALSVNARKRWAWATDRDTLHCASQGPSGVGLCGEGF